MISKSTKIGRNEPCVCGSGKKYKKCCQRTKDFLGFNYRNVPILIDKKLSKTNFKELLEYTEEVLFVSRTEPKKFSIDEGLAILVKYYELFDKNMEIFSEYISCQKSCNVCCNLYVDVTAIEAEYIRRYVKNNFSSQEIEELINKIKHNIKISPDHEQVMLDDTAKNKYYKAMNPCPFLSDDGGCSIYEARPVNCRKYAVFSDPDLCYPKDLNIPNSKREVVVNSSSIQSCGNIVKQITVNCMSGMVYNSPEVGQVFLVKHLSHWFSNGFDKINSSKYPL